jgi:LMBR1 domain-containing protein 1
LYHVHVFVLVLSFDHFQNSTLPNPMDLLLVACQSLFPLDYILYTLTVLFLLFCSMSGIRNMGIRFCWIKLYKIRWSLLLMKNVVLFVIPN